MEVRYFHGYAVREDGEVRGKRGGVMKHVSARRGHDSVTLYYDGTSHCFTVAKLVATVFIPNTIGDDAVVIHKDGDYKNNHKDNLVWSERGPSPFAMKVECTLPDGTRTEYESQNQAAKELGLASNATIRHYITGAMKDPRGGVWKKVE